MLEKAFEAKERRQRKERGTHTEKWNERQREMFSDSDRQEEEEQHRQQQL